MAMELTAGCKTILKTMFLTSALLVGGCAGYGPTNDFIGLTRSETLARLGPPNPVPANIRLTPDQAKDMIRRLSEIVDEVADLRASTPTDAAKRVSLFAPSFFYR